MNAIQQISLKLQMNIHPAAEVRPEILRSMWRELSRERSDALAAKYKSTPASTLTLHPALRRAG